MSQPPIILSDGTLDLYLDPDLYWSDEFSWAAVEQSVERSITGKLLIDVGAKVGGRPITLEAPDEDSAWMPRATVVQLQTWEAIPDATYTLTLRGHAYTVVFDRANGSPIEARPVTFVADPQPGEIGDDYLVTLRFLTQEI